MLDIQVHAFMLRICVVGAVNSSHSIRNPINIGRWLLLGASPSSSDAAPIQKTPNPTARTRLHPSDDKHSAHTTASFFVRPRTNPMRCLAIIRHVSLRCCDGSLTFVTHPTCPQDCPKLCQDIARKWRLSSQCLIFIGSLGSLTCDLQDIIQHQQLSDSVPGRTQHLFCLSVSYPHDFTSPSVTLLS